MNDRALPLAERVRWARENVLQEFFALKELLKTDNCPEIRRLCADRMREVQFLEGPQAEAHILTRDGIADLKSPDPNIRKRGANLLAGTTEPEALKALCEIGLRDACICGTAAMSLRGTTDPETLKWLCDVGLRHQDWKIRQASAGALAGTTDPRARKLLTRVAENDRILTVRRTAKIALQAKDPNNQF